MIDQDPGTKLLRGIWPVARLDWQQGVWLIFVIGSIRFYLVLQANMTGQYQSVSLVFLLMILLPIIILNKAGFRAVGLVRPSSWKWAGYSLLFGTIFCFIVYFIGVGLYDDQIDNWFVYISHSYPIDKPGLSDQDFRIYFLIYAFASMTFSPIGEELFYRGLVHHCFVDRYGHRRASYIDGAAFAITHLAHFGLIYRHGTWEFRLVPALLWVILMFFASLLFSYCKRKSGSLLGAILSHAAFNFVMIYLIFFYILWADSY
ncbi:MAG: CPBP family intramembrane metalloprotease [Saprospiraceae bacterium]|nr:CPBP family intramembrane metalloprotease [Saprospiraceae bacterium]